MNTNKDKIISKLKQEDQPSKGLAQPKLLKKKSNFYKSIGFLCVAPTGGCISPPQKMPFL